MLCAWFFFFQAEDGIRYLVRSRGLGDVYKRQRSNHGLRAAAANASAPEGGVSLLDILGRLKQFHTLLSETQRQVLQDIQAVEQMISRWR